MDQDVNQEMIDIPRTIDPVVMDMNEMLIRIAKNHKALVADADKERALRIEAGSRISHFSAEIKNLREANAILETQVDGLKQQIKKQKKPRKPRK